MARKRNTRPIYAQLREEEAFLTENVDRRLDTTHTRQLRLERNDRIRKAGLPRPGASGSWITTPPKAVATERKGAGWTSSDAAYFGSNVWDGVEPDRSHKVVGLKQAPGFTARVDNPNAKPLPQAADGRIPVPYKVRGRRGETVRTGVARVEPGQWGTSK